ncbi:hypothetical protein PABG_03953 [Paracoccidioides brasiliensis Pb03]|nr:hypothetical protein PABG_03953 [Paracoccidioides brasiliensis Pb03]
MEPPSFHCPLYMQMVPDVDSVPLTLPQNNVNNLKWEEDQVAGSQLQQLQAVPQTLASPLLLRHQSFQEHFSRPLFPPSLQPQTRVLPGLQSHGYPPSHMEKETQPNQSSAKRSGLGYTLACLNCRVKKIKCQPEDGGCDKCKRLGIPCPGPEFDERKRPSSKRYIRELHSQIEDLQQKLREIEFQKKVQAREILTLYELNQFPSYHPSSLPKTPPGNIIACLCDGRYQLDGTPRYAGPTSSLHLTLKEDDKNEVWSSVEAWKERTAGSSQSGSFEVDPDTQKYLLDLYWKYQHTELQVFHQTAFERDMAAGETNFYSKALLYCIMACSARISSRPKIRAMVLPPIKMPGSRQAPPMADRQCLFAEASRLLEEERNQAPRITTIQSLLLLSVIYCAFADDMKGLSLTTAACRLAIDMGLHRDMSKENFTQLEMEVRQITFWGCYAFDRLWSLYLGRAPYLRLDESVTIARLPSSDVILPLHYLIAGAWVSLLELVGFVVEYLNKYEPTTAKINTLSDQLTSWYRRLDPQLHYKSDGLPSIAILHMQYCAAIIVLYRPLAGFGKDDSQKLPGADKFRNICIAHAIQITIYLTDYRAYHRNATTLSGVGLHIIEMASTIFISDITERHKTTDVGQEYSYLAICVKTLLELEQTFLVAKNVRKVLKKVFNLCNLDTDRIKQILKNPSCSLESSPDDATNTKPGPTFESNDKGEGKIDMPTHGDHHSSTEPHMSSQNNAQIPDLSFPTMPYPQFSQQEILYTYTTHNDMYHFGE